jgi:large subunit ribosomal protein L21e
MPRSKGFRRKSRSALRKKARTRGLQPLGRLLHTYETGEKAVITIDPSVHKGMPHRRYQGRVGVVSAQRGRAYVLDIQEGGKVRKLIVRPEHVTPYTG